MESVTLKTRQNVLSPDCSIGKTCLAVSRMWKIIRFHRSLRRESLFYFAVRKIGLYPIGTVLPLNFVFVPERSVCHLYVEE
jgi:hypothetical protein